MRLFTVLMIVLLASCTPMQKTRWVTFQVDSVPQGAPVDVNGINYGVTPTAVKLSLSENYRGLVYGGGYRPTGNETYRITVFPPINSTQQLFSQTKIIKPANSPDGGRLLFDLTLH